MKDDIKTLHSIINNEYLNLSKQFNIQAKKNRIKNGKDIEDIFHDCLLKVLEKAEIDNFQYKSKEKTLNYINKTMRMKQKDIEKMKTEQQQDENNKDDGIDVLLYVSEQYDNELIQSSIFNKLFKKNK